MNIPVTFITVNYSSIAGGADIPVTTETGINILFDTDDIDVQKLITHVNNSGHHYIFSISIAVLHSTKLSTLLPQLYTLCTLSAAFRLFQNRIPVFGNPSHDQSPALQLISDYFAQQEERVDFIFFDLHTPTIQKGVLLIDSNRLMQLDNHQASDYSNQKIDQLIIFNAVNGSKEIAPGKISYKENVAAHLLEKIITLQNSENWNAHQLELWQKRASLYLSFIDLGKKVGEQEYYDIKNWYHNEYEVLPLWFKRLGHIVKAMTGKRSFKSLFTDNTKK